MIRTPCLLWRHAVSHTIQKAGAPAFGDLEEANAYFYPDDPAWSNVPYLNFNVDNRQMKLNANRCDNANPNWSVPLQGMRNVRRDPPMGLFC